MSWIALPFIHNSVLGREIWFLRHVPELPEIHATIAKVTEVMSVDVGRTIMTYALGLGLINCSERTRNSDRPSGHVLQGWYGSWVETLKWRLSLCLTIHPS